jgi:hypothetical protein
VLVAVGVACLPFRWFAADEVYGQRLEMALPAQAHKQAHKSETADAVLAGGGSGAGGTGTAPVPDGATGLRGSRTPEVPPPPGARAMPGTTSQPPCHHSQAYA